MINNSVGSKLDSIFLALSNGKRRGMINTLSYRPATVSQLADEFNLSLPAMHKHMKLLEKAQLVNRKKSGRTNFIALNTKVLDDGKDWIQQFHTEWGSPKETLDNYIASLKDSI